jgi:hypothetical protein
VLPASIQESLSLSTDPAGLRRSDSTLSVKAYALYLLFDFRHACAFVPLSTIVREECAQLLLKAAIIVSSGRGNFLRLSIFSSIYNRFINYVIG